MGTANHDRRRIYLVRHGEVDYFDPEGRPVRPDTVPLNAAGEKQARGLGELLNDVPLDRVVTSGLPRTLQTAAAIASKRPMKIEVREELQEIRPGKLALLPPAELKEAFLQAFPRQEAAAARFLGGESLGEFTVRVLAGYRALLEENDWRSLLLVAHGGVNLAILLEALGAGAESFGSLEQDPGALNILDVEPGGSAIIRLLNFTAYAPVKAGLELTTMETLYRQYLGKRSGNED